MIIIDYSGIAIAAIFSQDRPEEIEESLIRHMILNTLRRYNTKFRDEYGELVIACDSSSWRKEVFSNYKAKRKTARKESDLDWNRLFTLINTVRDELHEFTHYPVIYSDRAEADDIIATLTESTQEFGKHEPVMIVSSDKDFLQLQRYSNVKQFSPMKKSFAKVEDPHFYKFEHVCRGDVSDGVPNILSGDETFVDGSRQKPMRAKKITEWYDTCLSNSHNDSDLVESKLRKSMGEDTYRNYCRNKTVIDLDYIPKDIVESIQNNYDSQIKTKEIHKSGFLNYLIEKRCNLLINSVRDFFPNK